MKDVVFGIIIIVGGIIGLFILNYDDKSFKQVRALQAYRIKGDKYIVIDSSIKLIYIDTTYRIGDIVYNGGDPFLIIK